MSERLRGFWERVAVLGALAVAGASVARYYEVKLSAALVQLAEQVRKTDSVVVQVDSQLAVVITQRDSASREKDAAEAAAKSARAQARVAEEARRVFVAGAAQAPDTCVSLARDADIAIRAAVVEAEHWHTAYDGMSARASHLQTALDKSTGAAQKLREQLVELRNAGKRVVDGSKSWKRFLPQVGVGGAAGIDSRGLPNAVVGVTFGWRL